MIGDGYARYRGPVTDSPAHRHAAFQIAIAVRDEVAMLDAAGTCHRATALVVAPMAPHRILAADDVLTYFVEPRCAFADRLRAHRGVIEADELHGLREDEIRSAAARTSGALDPRLVAAMDDAFAELPMPELAARVGLSPQRLRALARQQLGMPLARWRAWSRLRRAAEALRDGQSLADAAVTAGFADQAHLTRWMREMMGLTPSSVLPVLRDQPRRAV
ncbi:hypothetical protein HUW46_02304 [Amycolatopsis sp. CA-230715]|nr:hypothetical protein HUW46_02304 [Amycolatopsis sp. CA-230715]